jgi:hypothetical protein
MLSPHQSFPRSTPAHSLQSEKSGGKCWRRGPVCTFGVLSWLSLFVVPSKLFVLLTAVALLGGACAYPGPRTAEPTARSSRASDRRPSPNSELRFAVIGDFGVGTPAQRRLARRMCAWRKLHPFDLVFTTGDNIYPNGSRRHFGARFFGPYSCLLQEGVEWHAALGNHDRVARGGRAQLRTQAFGFKGRNYVVRRPGVRFVIADSNKLALPWLRRATKPRAGERWTVVAFHHPVYSPGPHGSTPGFSPALPRLFSRRGVDLVLNGHDHLYSASRSFGGTRYVVTGGGGAPLYDCSRPWFTKRCFERHHFLYVVVARDRIRVRAVGVSGAPFAYFRTTGRL